MSALAAGESLELVPAAVMRAREHAGAPHVFPAGMLAGAEALALAALVDPVFLAEVGWDRERQVMHLDPAHPLLGRSTCGIGGCTARSRAAGVCDPCARRLASEGIDVSADGLDLSSLPPCPARGEGTCAVAGCRRVWRSPAARLCLTHALQRDRSGASTEAFLARDDLRPFADFGPCLVLACDRSRAAEQPGYCVMHRKVYYQACREDGFDEMRWRLVTAPPAGPDTVVLRGVVPVVTAQFLLGLQGRVRDGLKIREGMLRQLAGGLRLRQAAALDDCAGLDSPGQRQLAASLARYVNTALLDPETERVKDVWDLAAFGYAGKADFTVISQGWLRQCARDWALDDLTRRRGHKLTCGSGSC